MSPFGKHKITTSPTPQVDQERLERERVVELRGPLDDEQAKDLIAKLLFLQYKDQRLPITLLIDSPGGSVAAGMAVIDTVKYLEPPVHTRCISNAHGMAAIILGAGQRGERSVVFGSAVSLTPLLYAESDTATDAELEQKMVKRLLLAGAIATCSGREINSVIQDLTAGRHFDAAGAIEYGLADRMVD